MTKLTRSPEHEWRKKDEKKVFQVRKLPSPPPPHRQQLKKDAFLTILAHQPVYSEGPSLTSITNSLRLLRDDDNNLSPM